MVAPFCWLTCEKLCYFLTPPDPIAVVNETSEQTYVAGPPDTAFATGFGHLAGYEAGYYGYFRAKSLSLDMASVFRKSPMGFLDGEIGRRLRRVIYAVGYTREVDQSVEKFLGRKSSQEPFLEYL